jgi:hypothetical protein
MGNDYINFDSVIIGVLFLSTFNLNFEGNIFLFCCKGSYTELKCFSRCSGYGFSPSQSARKFVQKSNNGQEKKKEH